ncbi:MAG: AbrB/MazE/SpoVT family DNA-binding domain-containing protein [Candidatus Abyssobacteria bacterium SURF_5]|uniref:AbrB/MazE/SpoVT family DNA-binding domain-containing protein n=1 Tax=Abyssobacteria bacterium (strain SURF_5) TaxID=2093360 RepID=A0A3A4NV58_ABYX5|nr:MAG: AbrB/MazE/SpoVT family DNA-binding domain-containing protein [Candidatus Abyssubacteria bacterium SURF_5]
MLAKKTSKNQLTLPKQVVQQFPGVDYFEVSVREKKIVLTPVKITSAASTIENVRNKMQALGLQEEDIEKAIRWARRKRA